MINGTEYSFGNENLPFNDKTKNAWIAWIEKRTRINSSEKSLSERQRHRAQEKMNLFASEVCRENYGN